MLSVSLLCVVGLLDGLDELDRLPPHPLATHYYQVSNAYCLDLKLWEMSSGGYRADNIRRVYEDATRLRDFWYWIANATNHRAYFYSYRLRSLREARDIHDWEIHGWPSALPIWWLPHE